MALYSHMVTAERVPRRGDVYYADLSGIENAIGSEQTGKRPVLVIQNNTGNQHSGTTIVATMTTKDKKFMPTHIALDNAKILPMKSIVCTEQLKTIDKTRLQDFQGNVGNVFMERVDAAIAISLGMTKNEQEKVITMGEKMEYVKIETELDGEQYDWLDIMQTQLKIFSNIKQHIVNLKCRKKELEVEIEEILTYIESTHYNAPQGYQVYKLLKERRQKRREIMNELATLEAMIEPFNTEEMCLIYQRGISKMQGVEKDVQLSSVMKELMEKVG